MKKLLKITRWIAIRIVLLIPVAVFIPLSKTIPEGAKEINFLGLLFILDLFVAPICTILFIVSLFWSKKTSKGSDNYGVEYPPSDDWVFPGGSY